MKLEQGTIKKLNSGRPTIMYYDQKEDEVWVNEYSDMNSFTIYHNKNIFQVNTNLCDYGNYNQTKWTKKLVKQAVENTINYRECMKMGGTIY